MRRPKVSVVIPVHNGGLYIPRSLESIQRQTLSDLEIIIVDDGSTDESYSVIKKISLGDSRVRVIKIEHSGIVEALNVGMNEARAEFIARMDIGDISYPYRLELQLEQISKNEKTILCSTQVRFVDRYSTAIRTSRYPCQDKDIRKEIYVGNNVLIHPAVMFRNMGFRYSEKAYPAEDYEMWFRMLCCGNALIIDKVCVDVMVNEMGISIMKMEEQINAVTMIRKHYKEVVRNDVYKPYVPECNVNGDKQSNYSKIFGVKNRILRMLLKILYYLRNPKMYLRRNVIYKNALLMLERREVNKFIDMKK